MIKKVLIANRSEIAVRVITACREMGIKTVAIYSEPDKLSRHVSLADEAYQLEGQPQKVYLDAAQVVEIAKKCGADAVHPGYGFLSENPEFARNCADAGIKFIGPKPEIIHRMGSKVESRRAMEAAGVPVVPGTTDPVNSADEVKKLGAQYGYPIAIKASAGGGGRGLKVVRTEAEAESAFTAAQREGASYFGSGEVYVEKYLDHPRHIEVQILGDEHGNVIHLGERDCSTQRRHQKLIEESPAAKLDPKVRESLLAASVKGAKSLGYTSAGTFELLVAGKEFYFLEVNTRVQVEHPVTEYVTGIDIVKEQIRIANGEQLSVKQEEVFFRGHSIECRINAEDPYKNFMPAPGTVKNFSEPRMPWVRVDSACYSGYQILPFYDSLLAKLIVWGRDRKEAIDRMKLALSEFKIEGVATTIPFHLAELDDPKFIDAETYTTYIESEFMKGFIANAPKPAPPAVPGAAAGSPPAAANGAGSNGHGAAVTEKVGPYNFEVEVDKKTYKVAVHEFVAPGAPVARAGSVSAASAANVKGRSLDRPSKTASKGGSSSGRVKAPMHGVVKELLVELGSAVTQGQKLLIFEAMKMESEVVAPKAGKISALNAKQGDTVETDHVIMEISD
ncbi:MAG: acetyl-CoA carboxylase biotin carboxylase subunit [Candidatus Obscuribacterales bacterium]|nr:acetyl-CoA carboxylase biotin carboxylase subunit [Candidatus Obscuribacterales bacterium]